MSVLRWSLGVAVIVVALVFASLTAKPGDWSRVVAWADGEVARGRDCAADCPPMTGDPVPGNAFVAYRAADRLGAAVPGPHVARLRELVDRQSTTDEQAAAALAALPAGALDALRRATRTTGTTFETTLFASQCDMIQVCDLMPLHDALLLAARHQDAASERLDCWLDALACGVDLSATPLLVAELYGQVTIGRTLALATDEWLRGLGDSGLRRLASSLRTVDEVMPAARFPGWEVVYIALAVERSEHLSPSDVGLFSVWQTWEHGFSVKAMAAERVEFGLAALQAFLREDRDGEPWPERRQRLERLAEPDPGRRIEDGLQYAVKAERMRREALVELRFLRLAVAHHLGDEPPVLADPLGAATIGSRVEEGGIRLLCADPERSRLVATR